MVLNKVCCAPQDTHVSVSERGEKGTGRWTAGTRPLPLEHKRTASASILPAQHHKVYCFVLSESGVQWEYTPSGKIITKRHWRLPPPNLASPTSHLYFLINASAADIARRWEAKAFNVMSSPLRYPSAATGYFVCLVAMASVDYV